VRLFIGEETHYPLHIKALDGLQPSKISSMKGNFMFIFQIRNKTKNKNLTDSTGKVKVSHYTPWGRMGGKEV
jgi:hypothetical protein